MRHRSLRRPVVAALAAVLLLAGPPPAWAGRSIEATCGDDLPRGIFSDVPAENVHQQAIDCLAAKEVVAGTGGGRYEPEAQVSRGQLASMLVRMLEASEFVLPLEADDAFSDDDGTVHEYPTNRLAAIGVVSGKDDRTFDPSGPVSRGQLASLLVRAVEHRLSLGLPTKGDTFTDDDGSVHESSLDKAALAGVVDGVGDGRFEPNGSVRRDQVASFLVRALDLILTRPGWEQAVRLIEDCDVRSVTQTHALVVTLSLKDGGSHRATEPYIDAVFDEVEKADHCPPLDSVATE